MSCELRPASRRGSKATGYRLQAARRRGTRTAVSYKLQAACRRNNDNEWSVGN